MIMNHIVIITYMFFTFSPYFPRIVFVIILQFVLSVQVFILVLPEPRKCFEVIYVCAFECMYVCMYMYYERHANRLMLINFDGGLIQDNSRYF